LKNSQFLYEVINEVQFRFLECGERQMSCIREHGFINVYEVSIYIGVDWSDFENGDDYEEACKIIKSINIYN
jgi:hypothetical protein